MWQFIALTLALFVGANLWIELAVWMAAALTILSGTDYLVKNRKYLSMQ